MTPLSLFLPFSHVFFFPLPPLYTPPPSITHTLPCLCSTLPTVYLPPASLSLPPSSLPAAQSRQVNRGREEALPSSTSLPSLLPHFPSFHPPSLPCPPPPLPPFLTPLSFPFLLHFPSHSPPTSLPFIAFPPSIPLRNHFPSVIISQPPHHFPPPSLHQYLHYSLLSLSHLSFQSTFLFTPLSTSLLPIYHQISFLPSFPHTTMHTIPLVATPPRTVYIPGNVNTNQPWFFTAYTQPGM